MVLTKIIHVQAERIFKEIATEGSGPLLVQANDDNLYYVKADFKHPPCFEVINELFCAYIAQSWGLKVSNFALVTIPDSIVETYENECQKLSTRYSKRLFNNVLFFGSRQLKSSIELDLYINGLDKNDFKMFSSPLDIIKIGTLDLWVGNKDRKPNNPNILISTEGSGFDFCPIDHAAAFAYCGSYKEVTASKLFLQDEYRILTSHLIKSVAQHSQSTAVQGLKTEILANMSQTLTELDFIFEQIPSTWGFSKKAKEHIRKLLSDQNRNGSIASTYLNYIK